MVFIGVVFVIFTLVTVIDGFQRLNSRTSLKKSLSKLNDLTTSSHSIASALVPLNFDVVQYAFSGAVAGGFRALSRGLTFPFDTMKTVKQVQRANKQSPLFQEFTVAELFKGVVPAVLSAVPANAVFFVIYNYLMAVASSEAVLNMLSISGDDAFYSSASFIFLERLIFSSIATLPSNLIKTPAELLKQRAQVAPNSSMIELIKEAIQPPMGIRGLFLGNNAQLLRELPYNAIQMAVFDFLKDRFVGNAASRDLMLTTWGMDLPTFSAGLGFIAAGVAAALTQPADTVKTRLMAGPEYSKALNLASTKQTTEPSDNDHDVSATTKSPGIMEITRQILDEEGIEGLFVGVKYRVALVSFGGAIYFWTAELGRQVFDLHMASH